MVGGSDQLIARLHLLAGHPARARDRLLSSDAAFEAVGDRGLRSTTFAILAQVREVLGDREGAVQRSSWREEVGGQDDVINYAITHAVRARLALAERDSDAAERLARSAVDRAFEQTSPSRAETLVVLALVLEKLDRRQESITAARRALELDQAKCDRPGASQARALLEHLGAGVIARGRIGLGIVIARRSRGARPGQRARRRTSAACGGVARLVGLTAHTATGRVAVQPRSRLKESGAVRRAIIVACVAGASLAGAATMSAGAAGAPRGNVHIANFSLVIEADVDGHARILSARQ